METLRFLMAASFYPPYHLGGDAVHVQYLAEALTARGHEVHVEFSPAAYRLKSDGPEPLADEDRGVRLHPIPSPLGRAQPVAAYLLGASQAVSSFHESVVREVRPDVVHLHNISLLGRGLLRPHAGALTVYTAHDYWLRCPRNDLLKYGKRPCDAPSCVTCCLVSRRPPQMWRYTSGWHGPQGLDFAIAPSRFMARAIGTRLSCPVLFIPNFAPDPNSAGNLSEPQDYYLFVGALEPHKGVGELAAAASRLRRLRFKFVGRGSLAARLKELRNRDSPNIEIEGWKSHAQLGPLYKRAKALIIPSTCHENAPLAAVEALAWGTPLLVSRRGGLEELLQDGAVGRSFEPTGERLAEALQGFEAQDLAQRLRAPARSAYVRYHTPESYVDRYLDALRDPHGATAALTEVQAIAGDPPSLAVGASPEAGLP